jgi:putative transposase
MSRWKIVQGVNLYFVTTTIVAWQDIFNSIPFFESIIESIKYCQKNKGIKLHGYVIMPNHAHYIFSVEEPERLSNIMRDFNRFTSQKITTLLREMHKLETLKIFQKEALFDMRGNRYKVWQDGFHPTAIDTGEFFQQKLDYLHENPVRKGYVERPEYWSYSSARNYVLDDNTVINVDRIE